jgi:1-acyl-sn-glycerol-3-phosphate acyltransferase
MKTDTETELKRSALLVRLGRYLGGERLLFLAGRILAHLSIEGEAHIPRNGPCLFPYNHVSMPADILVNVLIRRRRPDVQLFSLQGLHGENPLVQFLERIGQDDIRQQLLYAYKGRGFSAGELLKALGILRQGGAIALAAEGELSWDGRLQYPLAPGTAWLALRSGAPVVPVVSIGGYDLQPRWQLEKMRLTGRLKIRAGRPFRLCETPITRLANEELEDANERIWQAMAALLGQASNL